MHVVQFPLHTAWIGLFIQAANGSKNIGVRRSLAQIKIIKTLFCKMHDANLSQYFRVVCRHFLREQPVFIGNQ